jgi:hypothetical protein
MTRTVQAIWEDKDAQMKLVLGISIAAAIGFSGEAGFAQNVRSQ